MAGNRAMRDCHMTILSRYIFRQTLGATLLILLSLTAVTWVAVALRQLNVVTTEGQDAWVFFKMTLVALPNLMAIIVPVALLIASIHVLNRLNGDSELIIMTAGGAPIWALLKPLIVLAFIVALGISLVNHVVGPWSQHLLSEYITQARTDLIAQVIQPGRFTTPETNLTIHIRDRSATGDLLGLLIHDGRDQTQITSYLADRGQIVKQGGGAFLMMQGGTIVRNGEVGAPPQIVAFDRYAVDLQRFQAHSNSGIVRNARERYTSELWSPNPDDPLYKMGPDRFRSELHDRLAGSLYPFGFVFLALAFVAQAQTTRQSRIYGVVWAFGLAAGGRLLGIGADRLTGASELAIILLYAIPLSAVGLGAIVAHRNMRPRPPSPVARWIENTAAAITVALEAIWRSHISPAATPRARG
jgi:lipopolysaccharide export system permease protein